MQGSLGAAASTGFVSASLQEKNGIANKIMESQILHPKVAAFQPEWDLEDIRMAFFKCTRWQVEETLGPINCPFHYFLRQHLSWDLSRLWMF